MARALAARLGFDYLDTGAVYRAVALAALRQGLDWNQSQRLAELARCLPMEIRGSRIYLNGEDVTDSVRSSEVTAVTRYSADNPQVHLVAFQQSLAQSRNVVTEGRDQGTVAFPNAQCKIFLTASPAERQAAGWPICAPAASRPPWNRYSPGPEIRDRRDASRKVGPLHRRRRRRSIDRRPDRRRSRQPPGGHRPAANIAMSVELPIYMDNHATTRIDPRVVEAMLPFFTETFGNAGSITHVFGGGQAGGRRLRGKSRRPRCRARGNRLHQRGHREQQPGGRRGPRYKDKGQHIVSVTTEHPRCWIRWSNWQAKASRSRSCR